MPFKTCSREIWVWGRSDSQGMKLHIALEPFGSAIHSWYRDASLLPTALPFLIHPQSESFPRCSGMINSSRSWSVAKSICHTLRLEVEDRFHCGETSARTLLLFKTSSHLAGAKGIGFTIKYCNQNKENSWTFSTLEVLCISQTQNSQLAWLKGVLHSACQVMLLQWKHYSSHFPALVHTLCPSPTSAKARRRLKKKIRWFHWRLDVDLSLDCPRGKKAFHIIK